MTSFLAGLLRGLFPALALAFAVIVLGGAGLYGLATGNALTAAVLAVAGLMAVVVLFGMLALQIENHSLLARIAQGQGQGAVQAAAGFGYAMAEPEPESLYPAPARAQGRRVEPVVTLRAQPSYEPI
ncbi:MAG: hypothetical protein JNN06_03465 [Gemmobacter sp.]|uniref:hypothetical protein n=1 Tax=Gemmobacter sp. TaxID=1898957 RepID=UPI001A3E5A44|nr:hypothetical protein [Gemmobacter sp.]MBL8561317.1 hypothetical protein [Gemmobacter sp.]